MVTLNDFNPAVALPAGLTIAQLRRAIEHVEKECEEMVDVYFEQANIFSAIVSTIGVRALDQVSGYERHRNADTAQQRFPDLKRRGSGKAPRPKDCLESKGSKRPWAIQSHYDHAGWYIIWRYLVDTTRTIVSGQAFVVWRVDMVFLDKSDWKYEGSTTGDGGGGRTHTFGVKEPSQKLVACAVYQRHDVVLRLGKAVPKNGD